MESQKLTLTAPAFRTNRPRPPKGSIDRPDLMARLSDGVDRRLTLVSAPAGSGKTTLLAQWVGQSDRRCAWLSLDETDNQLPSYVLSLIGALRTIHTSAGLTVLRMLRGSASPPPTRLAAALGREFEATQDPAILVLDNYERMQDAAVHEFTSGFIRHIPPSLHLVIASRSDPPLPLARLRAAGQLSEFRASDLYFSPEESARFLQSASARSLPPQVVEAIVDRSEGWPAGLRLAAISLSSASPPGVDRIPAGRSRLIMDYFLEEVLAQSSPEIIGTLLRSSILNQLNVHLISSVIDISASAAARFLDYLERNNLFVLALEGHDGWYRLHPMLCDTLRERLDDVETAPAVTQLHRRAAKWFKANGYVEQAIRHALSAGDVDWACEIAEVELLHALDHEDLPQADRWIGLLPQEAVRRRPLLLVIQARLIGGRTGWHGVLPLLDAAEAMLDPDEASAGGERALIASGLIDIFRAPVYFFGGDTARSLECAERGRKVLRDRFDHGAGWGGYFAGVSQYVLGRTQEGMRTLETVLEDGRNSSNSHNLFFGLLGYATTHLIAARLAESEHAAEEMLSLETSTGHAFGMAWSNYFLGALAYETNRLPEALQHFEDTVTLRQEASAFPLYDSMLGSALTRQALGRADEASVVLDEAEELILATGSIAFLPPLHGLRARVALMQGDLVSARTWLQATPTRMSPGPLIFLEVPPLTAARALLANPGKQAAQDALALIADVEERCRREHNLRYQVSVLALQALAMDRLGRRGAALENLARSVDLGRRGGFVRSFVDLGPPMASLLRSLDPSNSHTAYVDRLLSAFAGAGIQLGEIESIRVESLTRRELQILEFLQRRYSNEEIARDLGISVLTVKRHTGNLYAKLQADGRRDAVRRAALLGLLPQGDQR
jgi:LuxR family maltose regulon positive regulatory protein